jgi:hypothetical protein
VVTLRRIFVGLAACTACAIVMPIASSAALESKECFATPGKCGFPDPAFGNVGVPAGTKMVEVKGNVEADEEGVTLKDLNVRGTIVVSANKVTIEDSRVANIHANSCGPEVPCGNSDIKINEGVTGTVLKSDELTVEPDTTVQGAIRNLGSGTIAEKIYTHGTDGSWSGTAGSIDDSYFLASHTISREHVENIYDFGNGATEKLIVHHDTIFNHFAQTANIFLERDKGYKGESTVTDNLMAGGSYSIYAGYRPIIFKENRFARCKTTEEEGTQEGLPGGWVCKGGPDSHGYFPRSGFYGVCALFEKAVTTQSGNVWDDNNASIGTC